MSQGVLGFKYEEEKQETGMTGLAGLPVYLDLMQGILRSGSRWDRWNSQARLRRSFRFRRYG